MFDFDKLEESCVMVAIDSSSFSGVRTGSLIYDGGANKVILTSSEPLRDHFDGLGIVVTVKLEGEYFGAYVVSSKDCGGLALLIVKTDMTCMRCSAVDLTPTKEVKGMPLYMSSCANNFDFGSNTLGTLSQPSKNFMVEYDIPTGINSQGAGVVDESGKLVAVHISNYFVDIHCYQHAQDLVSSCGMKFDGHIKYGISSEMVRIMINGMSSKLDPNVSIDERLAYISRIPLRRKRRATELHDSTSLEQCLESAISNAQDQGEDLEGQDGLDH